MAITRVQAATPVISGFTTTLVISFASPPTVGNAVILAFLKATTTATTSVVDNRSNTYTLAKSQNNSGGGIALDVYYCGAITGTGTPFTVTVTGNATLRSGLLIEVTPGLVVDQTIGTDSSGATGLTGTTAALTAAEAFLVAAIATGSSIITVGVVSPTWTQEMETLATPGGEVDTRVVTGALGTTPSASWTLNGSNFYGAALVAFKSTAPAGPPPTTQVVLLLV